MTEFNELQTQIHMVMDKLSNGESIDIKDEWIDEAVVQFREALIKQLRREKEPFRIRASNAGRPSCVLQQEQNETKSSRNDYNHIMRMMIGDAVEVIGTIFIKASGANITGSKTKVEYIVDENTTILGETDIEIDDGVIDIKSASPYSFVNKWQQGWDNLYAQDSFGYVEQLFIYANGKKKRMKGWAVWDKSSGECIVVDARPTKQQMLEIEASIYNTARTVHNRLPFRKLYKSEKETFRNKETGKKLVPMVCTFCNYMNNCWPDAHREKQTMSKAVNPKLIWYTDAE